MVAALGRKLLGWFDWLRRTPAPIIDHPVFGRVRAAHRPKDELWMWECLDPKDTPRGPVQILFEADAAGPAAAHERQWRRILAQLESLTSAAAPLIARELTDWPVPFDPTAPWTELAWDGADLNGDARPGDRFALVYECKSWPDAMITVQFEGGVPVSSRLDD